MTKKIGIIGGGVCGIGLGKALRQAGMDFEIIETSSRLGGNWQPNGIASKMYDSVHLISSKNNTQFTDYKMPADYPPYPRHSLFFQYLQQLAGDFNLYDNARLETTVTNMQHGHDGGWTLTFQDGSQASYDFVVIANGLLRKPIFPKCAEGYEGESIHSAQYKSADIFRDKRVLIVGAGNSGCDIAVDAAHAAKETFHSTRRGYHYMPKFINGMPTQEWLMAQAPHFTDSDEYWEHVQSTFKMAGFDGVDYGLPVPDHKISECHPIMNSQILYHIGHGDIKPKPDIERCEGRTVFFSDGTQEEIDLVVWASGFSVDLPFLPVEIFDWRHELSSLFLRMVPAQHDDLLFMGYLNTPSGIGNIVNTLSRFAVAYLKAREQQTPAWETFRKIKTQSHLLDLGQGRFMHTERHSYEVDLWKYIKAINFMTAKLNAAQAAERPAATTQYNQLEEAPL
jgi:hypothetical protein